MVHLILEQFLSSGSQIVKLPTIILILKFNFSSFKDGIFVNFERSKPSDSIVFIGFDNLVLNLVPVEIKSQNIVLPLLLGILIPAVVSSIFITAFFLHRVRTKMKHSFKANGHIKKFDQIINKK
ncbi:hypothetical protein BpHYR1_039804 [Brachionus plicatilis]|uniref:Uncharacterized protein n=1 Tax=Brachionus plicatilis TaxID=10195 RepID=A0A3M7Q4Y8_BRAPC|nr:hypothetical protein BpHYR1_039804 [Brachionus plicatilis]